MSHGKETASQSTGGWTDTQKHLVETTVKVTGWGVAAGFVFAGWLMTDEQLGWREKPGTCVLIVMATAVISVLWQRTVAHAALSCHIAFSGPRTQPSRAGDDPTALVARAPRLAWLVVGIVVSVTLLACFDDYLDRK